MVISLIRSVSFDNFSISNFSHVSKFSIIGNTAMIHYSIQLCIIHTTIFSRCTQWIIINAKNKCHSGMKFWNARLLLTDFCSSLLLRQWYLGYGQVIRIFLSLFSRWYFTGFCPVKVILMESQKLMVWTALFWFYRLFSYLHQVTLWFLKVLRGKPDNLVKLPGPCKEFQEDN